MQAGYVGEDVESILHKLLMVSVKIYLILCIHELFLYQLPIRLNQAQFFDYFYVIFSPY